MLLYMPVPLSTKEISRPSKNTPKDSCNELEIRAVAGIYVTGFSPQTMYMIDEVEEIPYTEEEISKIPSITGYIVKEGDTLWNIAKHYGTTIEKMKQYNENLTEPLESGQKIFLLKEMENLVI